MVRNIFSLLATRQNSILSGASILMLGVFATKFFGLIRYRLLVHNFDSSQTSIFLASLQLPEFLFQILILGTLSVAFIPVFTEHLNKHGEKEAFIFANNILNLSMVAFGMIALVCFIFVAPLNSLFAPGFEGAQKALTDELTRIVLLGQLLLIIGSFFIGIGQSYQRFIIPALAPLMHNIGIIFGILVFSGPFGIIGPALGVVIGAALHVLIQLPLVSSLGYRYRFTLDFWNQGVKDVVKLMSFRNIGLAIEAINEKVGFALATMVSVTAPTLLTFAQQLHAVPIGIFAATISQAALPVLSREYVKGEKDSFKVTLLTTLHQILFLILPAAAILIVLRIPVVRLVYGADKFTWDDTVLTGFTLAYLAVGLVAQSVALLFIRGFYAIKDTKSPVFVSIVSVVINISLSLFFLFGYDFAGWGYGLSNPLVRLGLSYAIASNVSVVLLFYILDRKVGGFSIPALVYPAVKMTLAAVFAAFTLYYSMNILDQLVFNERLVFNTTRTVGLVALTAIAATAGLGLYVGLVWLFKVKELYTYVNILKKVYNTRINVKDENLVKESNP